MAVAVVIRVDGATARCQNKESSLSLSACAAGMVTRGTMEEVAVAKFNYTVGQFWHEVKFAFLVISEAGPH